MGKGRIAEKGSAGRNLFRIREALISGDGSEVETTSYIAYSAEFVSREIPLDALIETIEVAGTGWEHRNGAIVKIPLFLIGWEQSDGIRSDPMSLSPSAFFFNAACLQGWQKYMPTYRTGRIISIDHEKDTASICMRPAFDIHAGIPLEDDTLPGCSEMDEELSDQDTYIDQLNLFAERYPAHPLIVAEGRGVADYDTWWETIVDINTQVNQGITYTREPVDVWDVVSLPGAGDCEDYALTKMQMLYSAGIPANALGLAVGSLNSGPKRSNVQDIDHAWAVVFTTRGVYHLEQAPNVPLGRQPGSNFRILRYNGYEVIARKLDDVPIVYMDCNAEPFRVGDDVLVKFQGQSWSSPEAVGFSDGPWPCGRIWIKYVPMVYINYASLTDHDRMMDETDYPLELVECVAASDSWFKEMTITLAPYRAYVGPSDAEPWNNIESVELMDDMPQSYASYYGEVGVTGRTPGMLDLQFVDAPIVHDTYPLETAGGFYTKPMDDYVVAYDPCWAADRVHLDTTTEVGIINLRHHRTAAYLCSETQSRASRSRFDAELAGKPEHRDYLGLEDMIAPKINIVPPHPSVQKIHRNREFVLEGVVHQSQSAFESTDGPYLQHIEIWAAYKREEQEEQED